MRRTRRTCAGDLTRSLPEVPRSSPSGPSRRPRRAPLRRTRTGRITRSSAPPPTARRRSSTASRRQQHRLYCSPGSQAEREGERTAWSHRRRSFGTAARRGCRLCSFRQVVDSEEEGDDLAYQHIVDEHPESRSRRTGRTVQPVRAPAGTVRQPPVKAIPCGHRSGARGPPLLRQRASRSVVVLLEGDGSDGRPVGPCQVQWQNAQNGISSDGVEVGQVLHDDAAGAEDHVVGSEAVGGRSVRDGLVDAGRPAGTASVTRYATATNARQPVPHSAPAAARRRARPSSSHDDPAARADTSSRAAAATLPATYDRG